MIVKATSYFLKLAKKLITEEAKEELYDYLEKHPNGGDVIQGSGGVRKLRWRTGKNNKGKSGGVRIIYYYVVDKMVILITVYAKNEKENLSPSERAEIRKAIPSLVSQFLED